MSLANIYHLGIKELRSLWRDPMLMFLIVYTMTFAVFAAGTAMPETLSRATMAIVDENHSHLSCRIADSFTLPYFLPPTLTTSTEMDRGMDEGRYTFALTIPPDFERDVRAGKSPALQLNVDSTRMSQAYTGSGYIQSIINSDVNEYISRHRTLPVPTVDLAVRARFNPTLSQSLFGGVMEMVGDITLLAIVLTGAALIREREHGTIEHLLVMPVTPFEIMSAKIWSMVLVVLLASAFSLVFVIQGLLSVPIEGSKVLFLFGTLLQLLATASLGIFMATIARSMPQFGLLLMLVLLPLQMLSGATTPRENMPDIVQYIMLAAPDTHYVMMTQAILYRGAGLSVVWPQLVTMAVLAVIFFGLAWWRFRRIIATMA
ncbi:MAG TPA: ABC transporter permease [Halothiobacillus sp.]|nr:ABC transporter permease [Halothiobacillus sp.]